MKEFIDNTHESRIFRLLWVIKYQRIYNSVAVCKPMIEVYWQYTLRPSVLQLHINSIVFCSSLRFNINNRF
jgi:hypothetical protein